MRACTLRMVGAGPLRSRFELARFGELKGKNYARAGRILCTGTNASCPSKAASL